MTLSRQFRHFHVSAEGNHESIMEHGLDSSKSRGTGYTYTGGASGQYLFGSRRSADRAAVHDYVGANVYEVHTAGLDVRPDKRMPDAYVTASPIEPSRIKHVGKTVTDPASRGGRRVITPR